MAVVVFDADVLIAYLGRADVHHARAVDLMRECLQPGLRRLLSAVSYSEVVIGPLRTVGAAGVERVDEVLDRFAIEIVAVDRVLARLAAGIRVATRLKLPDAYAVATAVTARRGGVHDMRLESFDERVVKAYGSLTAADSANAVYGILALEREVDDAIDELRGPPDAV